MFNDTAIVIRGLADRLKSIVDITTKDIDQLNTDRKVASIMLGVIIDLINESIQVKTNAVQIKK